MKINKFLIIILINLLGITSCTIKYSFTGGNVDPNAKTVSVEYFKNTAQTFNATLSQDITESLRKKLTGQTKLSLVDGKGDLQFKGTIVDYSISPVAMVVGETAASNRLTIKVKVEFVNEFDEKMNFNEVFSWYQDYPSTEMLVNVEPTIVPQIIDKITDDVFQKAVVNW